MKIFLLLILILFNISKQNNKKDKNIDPFILNVSPVIININTMLGFGSDLKSQQSNSQNIKNINLNLFLDSKYKQVGLFELGFIGGLDLQKELTYKKLYPMLNVTLGLYVKKANVTFFGGGLLFFDFTKDKEKLYPGPGITFGIKMAISKVLSIFIKIVGALNLESLEKKILNQLKEDIKFYCLVSFGMSLHIKTIKVNNLHLQSLSF